MLRERVHAAMDRRWRSMLRHTVPLGITRSEIRPDVDGDTLATIVISTLEGAIMLSRLYGDTIPTHRAAGHLTEYIEQIVRAH